MDLGSIHACHALERQLNIIWGGGVTNHASREGEREWSVYYLFLF